MVNPSPQSRPQRQPVTDEDDRDGAPRSTSKTWMIWVGFAVVLLAVVVSALSLLLAPEEIPGAKDAIYFTKTPPHLPLVSAVIRPRWTHSQMAHESSVSPFTWTGSRMPEMAYTTSQSLLRGATESLFLTTDPNSPDVGPYTAMQGEVMTSTSAHTFVAPGLRCELVAVAVYCRSANRPLGDGVQPLAGVYALDGTRLSTESLIADGAAPEWVASEAWLANNNQTRLRWLWKVDARQPMRVAAATMWDAARDRALARNYAPDERSDWVAIEQVPALTASRPVRLIHNLVLLSTETLEMDAAPGAQCAGSRSRLTLIAAATGQMRMQFTGSNLAARWPYSGKSPSTPGILLPLDEPPEDGNRAFEVYFFARHWPLPAMPIFTTTLMFALEPYWAGSAIDVNAVDSAERPVVERGRLFDARTHKRELHKGLASISFRAYGDGTTSVTKLRVRLPERYLRLEIELPGIPGLPLLTNDDLLRQRVNQVQFADDYDLSSFAFCYGLCELGPRNWRIPATPPSIFKSTTLGELLLDAESRWPTGMKGARVQFRRSGPYAVYEIYVPAELRDVLDERWRENLERYLRK